MENEEKPKEDVNVEEKAAEKTSKGRLWDKSRILKLGFIVLAAVLFLALFTNKLDFLRPTGMATGDLDAVDVELYIMSQCPYGVQAFEQFAPIVKEMGDAINFNVDYVLYPTAYYEGQESMYCIGELCSMHGIPEIEGDIVQLCAMEKEPEKALDFISCMNRDAANIPENWELCAQENGLDVDAVRPCLEGEEGLALLKQSAAKAMEAGAQGSPYIIIDGQPYSGMRDTISLKRAICNHVPEHKACEAMPECVSDSDCVAESSKIGQCVDNKCQYLDPVAVEVVVLDDSTCLDCATEELIATTKQIFLGAEVNTVDVSSEEGQQLVESLGIELAPALLFAPSVKDTYMWQADIQFQSLFEEKGDWFKLRDSATGASHFIDEEKRAEQLEELGIRLGDNKPTVNLFVMAQCPYGTIAVDAMKPVVETLGDSIDFHLDFIANEGAEGFTSLHGQVEVEEDIRQLCAMELASEKYLDYIACQNQDAANVDANWESCAEEAGIDVDTLAECSEGSQGEGLLSESIEAAQLFQASGSPSLFIDGEKYSGYRTPAAFLEAICGAFDDAPEECNEELSSTAEGSNGSC